MLLWGIATIYTLRRFYMLMRRTTISHFSFKRNFQTQSKDSMPTRQGNTDPIIVRSDQHSPSPDQKRGCKITIISFSRSICRGGLAALIGVTGKPYPSCLSCHSHPIRPCGAPSPRGEGCDTRIPSSKRRRRSRHLNSEPNESKEKRSCEEMRIHFFTAPFSCLIFLSA